VDNDRHDQYVSPKGAVPTLGDLHSANFYNRTTKQIYTTLCGSRTVKIITQPILEQ